MLCIFQLVFVSVGVAGARAGRGAEWPSQQPPPPRALLPTLLLLKPQYFHRLFALMQTLGQMTMPGSKGVSGTYWPLRFPGIRFWIRSRSFEKSYLRI